MKTVIVSPHTDDAVFSLGSCIIRKPLIVFEDVTVLSIFAGIPQDIVGMSKHVTLRSEHAEVCKKLGIKEINGEFLDDVYLATRDLKNVVSWLQNSLQNFDVIFMPLGIHHPDHILAHAFTKMTIPKTYKKIFVYKELPYSLLYEKETDGLLQKFEVKMHNSVEHSELKTDVCRIYKSQIDDSLIKKLSTQEEFYLI